MAPYDNRLPCGLDYADSTFAVTDLCRRKIFLSGGTGFLGKVTLSMLLDRFPDIARDLSHGPGKPRQ